MFTTDMEEGKEAVVSTGKRAVQGRMVGGGDPLLYPPTAVVQGVRISPGRDVLARQGIAEGPRVVLGVGRVGAQDGHLPGRRAAAGY